MARLQRTGGRGGGRSHARRCSSGVKFVAIAASNLDEFFMVRVAALEEAVAAGDESRDLAGLTPTEQLRLIRAADACVRHALYALTRDELLPKLAERRHPARGRRPASAIAPLALDALLPDERAAGR